MNKKMILIIASVLLTFQAAVAQLGYSKNAIIYAFGKPDTLGTEDSGDFVIYRSTRTNQITKNTYSELIVCYFRIAEDGRELCHYIQKILPATEIDFIVSDLNKKFDKIDNMLWKDNKQNIIYRVSIDGRFCLITYRKDN